MRDFIDLEMSLILKLLKVEETKANEGTERQAAKEGKLISERGLVN